MLKAFLPGALFLLAGLIAPEAQGALSFQYSAASDVPVTSGSYTASGDLSLSLGFAPATGTTLMVVNNTGPDFIAGTFRNLRHGQTLTLSYSGKNYRFVANYFGGTGNDLVLQYANVRLLAWSNNEYGELGNSISERSTTAPAAVLEKVCWPAER